MNQNIDRSHGARPIATALPACALLATTLFVSALWPAGAMASQALAQRYSCVACHQATAKTIGPPWKAISEKYGDGKTTADQLAAIVKAGSTGKWGPMPMPPQRQVPDADMKLLAQWLLDGAK